MVHPIFSCIIVCSVAIFRITGDLLATMLRYISFSSGFHLAVAILSVKLAETNVIVLKLFDCML